MVPGRILAVALAGAAALLLLVLWLALKEPWLGVIFADAEPAGAGLRIEAADARAQAAGLRPGELVRAIRAGGRTFEIPVGWLVETPSYFIHYRNYNEFLRRQAELHSVLQAPGAELVRADGRAAPIAIGARPLDTLPAPFWFQAAYALLAFSVGATLLAFRPADTAARWFALASFGFFIGTMMRALYGSRSLMIDAQVLRAALAAAHAAALLASAALANFAWHFPRRLGAHPVPAAIVVFAIAAWIVDTWQLLPTTNLAYRGPMLLMFLHALAFAAAQYWSARRDPVNRAIARWVIFVLLAGPATIGAGMVMVALGHGLGIPRGTHGLSTVVLMYLGMVVLILRHRAFDLERWWFEGWVWFLCGALVIGLDVLLVYALSMQAATALALSLVAAGWLYFPLRQWLLATLWRRQQRDLRELFPELVRILLAPADRLPTMDKRWRELLARVFEPRSLARLQSAPDAVCIEQAGLRLVVPQAAGRGAVALDYADGGARLFSRRDARLAQGLLDLLRQGAGYQDGYWRGVESERDRIARDLHDDVGAKLLTLIHEASSERVAALARSAVAEMRAVVAGLRAGPLALADALADWRAELAERCDAAACAMAWRQPESPPARLLSPRQQLNLGRVLREAASNALRHAGARSIDVTIEVDGGALHVVLRHDGAFADPAHWQEGAGVAIMRRRAGELGGGIAWSVEHSGAGGSRLRLELSVPLPAERAA